MHYGNKFWAVTHWVQLEALPLQVTHALLQILHTPFIYT